MQEVRGIGHAESRARFPRRHDRPRRQGNIITTGSFTSEARKEAVRDGAPPIELVDGEKLASMLEKLELGLRPRQTFEVDTTFFEEYKK